MTTLLYAILARINEKRHMIIYILEQHLSFLLKHQNSIIIQVEVSTDVTNLAEGIGNGLFLAPNLMYVSNPRTSEEYLSLMTAAQSGVIVLVSTIAIDEQHLYSDLKKQLKDDFPLLLHYIRKTITVQTNTTELISLIDSKIDPK